MRVFIRMSAAGGACVGELIKTQYSKLGIREYDQRALKFVGPTMRDAVHFGNMNIFCIKHYIVPSNWACGCVWVLVCACEASRYV